MIVGYFATIKGIANSKGETCTEAPFLEWLLNQGQEDDIRVFYDIDSSVAAILRLIGLTEEEGKKLLSGNERLYIDPYTLTYYHPRKYFSIKKGHGIGKQYIDFFDAGQYFPVVKYSDDYSMTYAKERALEAQKIVIEVTDIFSSLGMDTHKMASPINAFNNSAHMKNLNLPNINNIPKALATTAYDAQKNNWIECYQKGYWPNSYTYDINSSYAYQLSQLMDFREGEWVESDERPPDAVYGFLRGELTIFKESVFHPFIADNIFDDNEEDSIQTTPVGIWHDALTLQEYDFLYKYKLGEYAIRVGYWWIPPKDKPVKKPLRELIEWLQKEKQNTDNELKKQIIKYIYSGIWGYFGQMKGVGDQQTLGDAFNPVWAAIVSANSRLEVARVCLDNGIIPLRVVADGLTSDKPLKLPISDVMGNWKLAHSGGIIILNPGTVAIEGKTSQREFTVAYDWLLKELRDHPEASSFEMTKYSPHLLMGVVNRGEWDKLGTVRRIEWAVGIEPDFKRKWVKEPKIAKDILTKKWKSKPWVYSDEYHKFLKPETLSKKLVKILEEEE